MLLKASKNLGTTLETKTVRVVMEMNVEDKKRGRPKMMVGYDLE